MRRFWYRRILIILVISALMFGTQLYIDEIEIADETVSKKSLEETELIPAGIPLGIYLKTDGILVLDTEEMESLDGSVREPAKNLVRPGDYITDINGVSVSSKEELVDVVEDLSDAEVVLSIRREKEVFEVSLEPVEVNHEEYKLGIWVRDSVQGLGTVTFFKSDNSFGALGHGIHDVDTEGLIEMERGNVYGVNIIGIRKGESGEPGGIEGVILYHSKNVLGVIEKNTERGIYGRVYDVNSLLEDAEAMEICEKREICVGKAYIRCMLDGQLKDYEIEIVNVDYFTRNENKGLMIRVTDEELIEKTGGIVQGMSGSPIIQDGKLVGAVTHVLVNDPTRGYGIFIENMLDAAG